MTQPRLTADYVTITRAEYEKLKAEALYADMVGDFISDMPTSEWDLFYDDPRYEQYMRIVNPEYAAELFDSEDEDGEG